MKVERPNCPACSAPDPLPILYDLPGRKMWEQSERGEIVLGRCILFDDQPEWHCPKCQHKFRAVVNG